MSLAEEIYQHSLNLPEEAAREALDFVEFLEQRYACKSDGRETSKPRESGIRKKQLLANMPNVGNDEDFMRTKDYGRDHSWES